MNYILTCLSILLWAGIAYGDLPTENGQRISRNEFSISSIRTDLEAIQKADAQVKQELDKVRTEVIASIQDYQDDNARDHQHIGESVAALQAKLTSMEPAFQAIIQIQEDFHKLLLDICKWGMVGLAGALLTLIVTGVRVKLGLQNTVHRSINGEFKSKIDHAIRHHIADCVRNPGDEDDFCSDPKCPERRR